MAVEKLFAFYFHRYELEEVYLKFFEDVLEVNEQINVAGVRESIGALNEAIEYYMSENAPSSKYGYLRDVRRILSHNRRANGILR